MNVPFCASRDYDRTGRTCILDEVFCIPGPAEICSKSVPLLSEREKRVNKCEPLLSIGLALEKETIKGRGSYLPPDPLSSVFADKHPAPSEVLFSTVCS